MASTDRMLKADMTTTETHGCIVIMKATYEISVDASLNTVDLEQGDNLPEDSNYEILDSRKEISSKSGTGAFARVTARKFLAWGD